MLKPELTLVTEKLNICKTTGINFQTDNIFLNVFKILLVITNSS